MPKIVKKKDRRIIEHEDSYRRRLDLLTLISQKEISPDVISVSCRTQAGLASLDIPSRGIKPMSLNTLKATAFRISEVAWNDLDQLRRIVAKLAKEPKVQEKSLSPSNPRNLTQLDEEFRVRALLYRAYADLMRIANSQGSKDEDFASKLAQHKALFKIEFGLRKVPGNG